MIYLLWVEVLTKIASSLAKEDRAGKKK